MTRAGFRWLMGIFLGALLLGTWLVLYAISSSPPPQARTQTLSCERWLAQPRAGRFRLTGCTLDAARSRVPFGPYGDASVEVVHEGTGPRLFVHSYDPDVVARVERLQHDRDRDARARTVERYGEQLHVRRTIEGDVYEEQGSLTPSRRHNAAARDYLMTPVPDMPGPRPPSVSLPVGITLIAMSAPLALLLFFVQRRWRKRAARLRPARPRVF